MKFTVTHFDGTTSEVEAKTPGDVISSLSNKTITFSISAEDGSNQSFITPFIVSKANIAKIQGLVQSKVVVYKSFHPWGREASFLTDVARNYKEHHSIKFSPLISKLMHLNLITAEVVDKRCKNIKVTAKGTEAVKYFKDQLTYDCLKFDDINTIFAWFLWQRQNTGRIGDFVISKAQAYSLTYYKYKNNQSIIESNAISTDLYDIIKPKTVEFLISFWKHWSYLYDKRYETAAAKIRLKEVLKNLLVMVPEDDWAIILTQPNTHLIQDLIEDVLIKRYEEN